MRGDFDLLNLSRNSTSLRHYSCRVDEASVKPYLTIVHQERLDTHRANPLEEIAKQLQAK